MGSTFEEALVNCGREPIHIPGAIQPFGVLFAIDEELRITHCSENVTTALGREPAATLGCSIEEVVRNDLRPRVRPGDFESGQPFKWESEGGRWNGFLHRHHGQLILELETATEVDVPAASADWVRDSLGWIGSAMNMSELCQTACEQIKRLTGLDGVMVYKFHDDGHGEVIAEAKDEPWSRYLGLHYPASDIPPQARAIFLENWVRMIPERDYSPVRLVSRDAAAPPLDLGRSLLRSVSPVHIEYLRNMEVQASLTLSLISQGRLWGLIAGHHYSSPQHISYERRTAAELIARLVSQQLARTEELAIATDRARGQSALQTLVLGMRASTEPVAGLVGGASDVRDLLGCSGAAVVMPDGRWQRIGETPSRPHLTKLAAWLDQRPDDWQVFHSDQLVNEYPEAADFKDCASGLLALRIPKGRGNYIFWFKPEVLRTITWAGDPNKPVTIESSAARLRPRASFEQWTQTVQMKSLPWARWEIELVEALASALLSIDLQRQYERELQARAAAEWANEQKEQLLAMVSHDLKNPLHSLIVGVTLIQKTIPADALSKASTVLLGMQRSLQSMGHLIADLLSVAKLESGTIDLQLEEHLADSLFADAFELLLPIAVEKGVQLEMSADTQRGCRVRCDRERILQVLSNLIGNAVKFTPPGGRVSCRVARAASEVCFSMVDTGPGIARENLTYVFDRFWQARQTRRLGTGLGLSIAKGLITAHGGRIWAESELGQGSTFHFTLPLQREEA
ncbi:GAF domain-containing protein [Steroidobacter sp. S1-65]|uniref:histidine kinase n=1 Tax=Steroidobacter gossypii TaxID=2805490 RepID=A0ABS1WRY6_9GAMM|nr:ATP-binding protein [Steroidobacter gossypii]MBM0103741.1 GAF domain-containing protein [Steroidobacter gossypii]